MEKAHGWEYVRSKNNGKNRDGKPSTTNTVNGLATPQTSHVQTPSSHGDNIATPEDDDYDIPQAAYDSSTMYDQQNQLNFPEYNASDMDIFAPNQHLQLDFSPISDLQQSGSSNGHSPYSSDINPGQDHFRDNFQNFTTTNTGDFNLFENEDLYSANVQLPTPTHDVFQRAMGGFETSGIPLGADPVPHISPVGHGNTMLYTPTSLREVDEGFEDFVPANCQQQIGNSNDFQLFPSSTGGTIASSAPSGLFGEIPRPNFFPGTSAQDLLDFHAATTAAATQHHNLPTAMDWSSDGGQYNGYGSN